MEYLVCCLLTNLFLSQVLTPTVKTLPPCMQPCPLVALPSLLLKHLNAPNRASNPLLCHYFCYYIKWVYDNEMFTISDTLTCSYAGLGEEISDLQSLKAVKG